MKKTLDKQQFFQFYKLELNKIATRWLAEAVA